MMVPEYFAVLSRNHFTKIFNTVSKPTLRGSLGRLVGTSLGKNCCFNTLIFTGGQGGAPLGLPPLWGRVGVSLVNRKNLRHQIGFYPVATE